MYEKQLDKGRADEMQAREDSYSAIAERKENHTWQQELHVSPSGVDRERSGGEPPEKGSRSA